MSSYFFLQAEKNSSNGEFLTNLEDYADKHKKLIYVLNRPLTDQKYQYNYSEVLIVLSPKTKVAIIDFGKKKDQFEDYIEDIIEDIGSISDKYQYKEVIGRPRKWRDTLFETEIDPSEVSDVISLINELKISNEEDNKKLELIISLFIGSINDIERVKEELPKTLLDKVKQKIQLFDGDQTRFVYQNPSSKRITIQGLSGTGKTELLLHKLKDLYTIDSNSMICFTCHNRILADSLKKRIPSFFNFMKVEQQIEWGERLWCFHAWGSASDANSGAYRFICAFYEIPFYAWSYNMSFGTACKLAIDHIKAKYPSTIKPAFSYMFIDESQDFDENFFALCELVTEKNIYVAGDIFQSIFDEGISKSIAPDFLLGKCYRTDPKTLMFAHGLGMGLFETAKLRWLEDDEWRSCGYYVRKENNPKKIHLSREPLKRFEDLEDNFESIRIVEAPTYGADSVITILKEIVKDNATVTPDDIGIILLDTDRDIYELADRIEVKIQKVFGWPVNKAYESKEKVLNSIFVSNRNNVKGLEFPFVICLTKSIKRGPSYRNSLYTMLTRSFIKSFLILPTVGNSGLTDGMKKGLEEIISTKEMIINEPSEKEKKDIQTRFKYGQVKRSFYDSMMQIFKDLKIDKKYHEKLFTTAKQMDMMDSDFDLLKDFVVDNFKYLKSYN